VPAGAARLPRPASASRPRRAVAPGSVALEAIDVSKAYGATLALDRVSFQALAGKVNIVLGENGAGKSTLMKILAGEEMLDSGRIRCAGEVVQLRSPREARQHGIAIIHQELSLFPELTVADNIFAGRELRRAGIIDEAGQERQAAAVLARLDPRIHPNARLGSLAVGQRQVVEIAKALVDEARVLIMDEPTSALSDAEVTALFRIVRELTSEGVAVIYISHRMDEIFRIGDMLTVFRDGRRVGSASAAEADMDWIFETMLGSKQRAALREVKAARAQRPSRPADSAPALRAEGLLLADPDADRLLLDDVSFELWPGEVLGVYGLLGAGKTELAEAVAGYRPEASGSVRISGAAVAGGIRAHRRAGIALVPEDRQRDALVRMASVADNMLLGSFPSASRSGIVLPQRAGRMVRDMIAALSIRIAHPGQPAGSLSGGNQQKAIIARALFTSPKVLVLDEPTRGIDIGAKAEVFQIMRRLAESGVAVLFASSELPEVMAIADRILVLSRGRVRGVFDAREATEADIVRASANEE
jgi:erythritol transport system ATP-binding protein